MIDTLTREEYNKKIQRDERNRLLKYIIPWGTVIFLYMIFLPVIQKFFGIID